MNRRHWSQLGFDALRGPPQCVHAPRIQRGTDQLVHHGQGLRHWHRSTVSPIVRNGVENIGVVILRVLYVSTRPARYSLITVEVTGADRAAWTRLESASVLASSCLSRLRMDPVLVFLMPERLVERLIACSHAQGRDMKTMSWIIHDGGHRRCQCACRCGLFGSGFAGRIGPRQQRCRGAFRAGRRLGEAAAGAGADGSHWRL